MKRIHDLLGGVFEDQEVLKAVRAQIVMKNWSEIVGEMIANHSEPDRYDRGTLWIAATGTAWAQEIRMQEELILNRLNEAADEPKLFEKIRVGVRKTRR